MKIRNRIFFSIFFCSLFALLLVLLFVTRVMYSAMTDDLQNEIKNEAMYISSAINSFGDDTEKLSLYISENGRSTKNRITLCLADGTVIYDNYADAEIMGNHSDRPEIAAAAGNGSGSSVRASDTLGEKTFYYAVRLDSGNILRIANTSKSVMGLLEHSMPLIVLIAVIVIGVSLGAAVVLSDAVIKPINDLDLDDPASNDTYEELSRLLSRMDRQNKRINAQIEELSGQKKELSYIMENMNEGLVIFGASGRVLSANHEAERIFGSEAADTYTRICRDKGYLDAVEAALRGEKATARLEKNGRIYRLAASPVTSLPDYCAVLFVIDITEQEGAEQMRREFSANVSHELKTPLTSIMGAAELIETGFAKPEDVPAFAEKIHTEANRLLMLIQDIIKLSRLDEGELTREFELLSLDEICRDTVSQLSAKAKDRDITLKSDIEAVSFYGVKPVLHEMIFNLIDNGIAYNKTGGFVEVSLKKKGSGCVLKVTDNGIGIPAEHQQRIFERFYRVDKSRSKATGGTGLGLSIVKHGASLHGGKISLSSEVGKGTEIIVDFSECKKNT